MLLDVNDNWAMGKFGTIPGVFEEKDFDIGPDSPLWTSVDAGFDFSRVKKVIIDAMLVDHTGNEWIDAPFFWREVEEGILRIESVPTGKTGTITVPDGTFNFITPSEITRPVGTEVTVSIDPTDFKQWENGSTNPERTLTLVGGLATITAYYETVTLPLLRIASYDQDMNALPAEQGVKLIYKGIEQYVDVPFAGRVGRGEYTLVAVETGERVLDFWKKPDGTTTTEKYITFYVDADTTVEVHWTVKKKIPPNLLLLGAGLSIIGLIFVGYLTIKR